MKNEDNETEILLGNKQLLGIFFVVAVLIGLAFTGGYMVGHGSSKKTSVAASAPTEAAATPSSGASSGTGGETHSVGAESSGDTQQASGTDTAAEQSATPDARNGAAEAPAKETAAEHRHKDSAAAARRAKNEEPAGTPEETPAPAAASPGSVVPHSGQTFLQVAAVGRSEAEAVADVLHKKGFRAHAIPKPGSSSIYRVLIGPVRDTADLSATRDSLRRAGFRDVIVQRY